MAAIRATHPPRSLIHLSLHARTILSYTVGKIGRRFVRRFLPGREKDATVFCEGLFVEENRSKTFDSEFTTFRMTMFAVTRASDVQFNSVHCTILNVSKHWNFSYRYSYETFKMSFKNKLDFRAFLFWQKSCSFAECYSFFFFKNSSR